MASQMVLGVVPRDIDRLLTSGLTALQHGNWYSADLHLRAALAAAERAQSLAALLCAWQLLGHLALFRHDLPTATEHYRRTLKLSMQLDYEYGVASAMHNLGTALLKSNRTTFALPLIAVAHQLYDALNVESGRTATACNLLTLAVVTPIV